MKSIRREQTSNSLSFINSLTSQTNKIYMVMTMQSITSFHKVACTVVHEISYMIDVIMFKLWCKITGCKSHVHSYSSITDYTNNNSGNPSQIIIGLHGMRSMPHQFIEYIKLYESMNPSVRQKTMFVVPEIINRGDCDMNTVLDNLKQTLHPLFDPASPLSKDDIPICFIGISNGGRIALQFRQKLLSPERPVHIISLGSPLRGTNRMNILLRFPLFSKIIGYHPALHHEMFYHQTDMKDGDFETIPNFTITCYAAKYDHVVAPTSSSFHPNGKKILIDNRGHLSLPEYVAKDVLTECMNYFEEQEIKNV